MDIQITFRNLTLSEAVRDELHDLLMELSHLAPSITMARAVVAAPTRPHHHAGRYEVRLELHLPGGPIVVAHDAEGDRPHQDVYVAVRDAVAVLRRRLEDHLAVRRGYVKTHAYPMEGHVVRLVPEQDYGFIETSDGLEVYFHRHSVVDWEFDRLRVGQRVQLALSSDDGTRGPQASTVHPQWGHYMDAQVSP